MKTLEKINPLAKMLEDPSMPMIQRIERLERYLKQFPQIPIEVHEHRLGNTYLREGIIPKGIFGIGAFHKYAHLSIMAFGDLFVWSNHDGLRRYQGYNIIKAEAGIKRCFFALENTSFTNIHNVEDGMELIKYLTYKDYNEFKTKLLENSDV
jgi:hypothetical protein